MANKNLFGSLPESFRPPDAVNEANGPAYALAPKHALAQYVATGCLNTTFYASGEEQLSTILALCGEVDSEFIARTAIFSREQGRMKDAPALLCAVLAGRDTNLLETIFPRVIETAKMLRNFVQMIRSGVTGRSGAAASGSRRACEVSQFWQKSQ